MANAGWPGALAAHGMDGAAATCQRVHAALGAGCASTLSISAVTPDAALASASRRLAVRSSAAGCCHSSMTTLPTPGHRTASAAARSSASGSGNNASSSASVSMPMMGHRPGAYRPPPACCALSWRNHNIGVPARPASTAANPVAAAASSRCAAKISCNRPHASPPPSATSMSRCPVATCRSGPWPPGPSCSRCRRSMAAMRRRARVIGPANRSGEGRTAISDICS